MNAFFVTLRSTQKAFKNIVLYLDLIFYRKWVTSIYNAENFSSFSSKHIDKQALSVYNIKRSVAEWCNGSTTDSDSVCWGSNPYSAAKNKTTVIDRGFIFYNGIRTRRERSGRKQSGGLFSPTWATSEARRRRRQPPTIAIIF